MARYAWGTEVVMRSLLRVALVAGMAAAFTGPAAATTIAALSVEQMTDASELVVRGTVESVDVEWDEHGRIVTVADVRVDATFKGDAEVGDYLRVESPGGSLDGWSMPVVSAARYSVGEDAVLFLSEHADGQTYGTVGMQLGKYSVRPDPLDGTPLVVQVSVPYGRVYDARFLPVPPKGQRVALSSLESQVRARVDLGWDGQPIPGISADRLRAINKLQPGVR